MFSHLQIVPAGHDRPLPARLSHTSSPREDGVLAPSTLTPAGESEPVEPYEIFFYLYKPNAKFKKSAPPEPQFQLCVVECVLSFALFLILADQKVASLPRAQCQDDRDA